MSLKLLSQRTVSYQSKVMPRAQAVIETAHVMHTYRNMSREQREKDCGFLLTLFWGTVRRDNR